MFSLSSCLYWRQYHGWEIIVSLNPGVKIYHDCVIGEGCIIHAGSVIGSDGFGFAPQSENEYMKIPQLGNVILED